MSILAIGTSDLAIPGFAAGLAAGLTIGLRELVAYAKASHAARNGKNGRFDPVLCSKRGERLAVVETTNRIELKNIRDQLDAIFRKLSVLQDRLPPSSTPGPSV